MLDRMGVQGCQCGDNGQESRNEAGSGGKREGNISAMRWLSMRKYKRPHLEPSQTSSSGCEQWRSHKLLPKHLHRRFKTMYIVRATMQPHQARWTRYGYFSNTKIREMDMLAMSRS